MNKIIKNQILLIIVFILKYIKLTSPLALVFIFNFNKHRILTLISLIVYFFILVLYCFIKWKNIFVKFNEKYLVYQYGLLFKKSIQIPIKNLNLVKVQQNFVQKIFNICSFKLKDESIRNKKAEINMILNRYEIFRINNFLKDISLNNINIDEFIEKIEFNTNKPILNITTKELILFAITGNTITFGIGVIFATEGFLKKLDKYLNFHVINIINPIKDLESMFKTYGAYISYVILAMLIIFFATSTLISVIQKFIKFYNFKIYKDEKNITINYGLISKKNYIFPIENVIAITLNQNFIKQLFNLYKVKIHIIGYGQEKKEQAILYPVISDKNIEKFFNIIFPDLIGSIKLEKSPKRAFSKFFTLPVSTFLILYLNLLIINSKFRVIIWILPFIILSRYLNYKNVSIGFNKNVFLGINGGLYKNILILKTFKIESIEKKSSYFQRTKGVCTYKVYYFNGKIKLKHLDENIFFKLKNIT